MSDQVENLDRLEFLLLFVSSGEQRGAVEVMPSDQLPYGAAVMFTSVSNILNRGQNMNC